MRALLICCAFLAIGCSRKQDSLSGEDVASALGMHWWLLRIPDGVEVGTIGVRALTGKKASRPRSASGLGGRTVRAMLWEKDDRLMYALVGDGLCLRGSIPNPFKFERAPVETSVPDGSEVRLGQVLVKKALDRVSISENIKPGEIAVAFDE